MLSVFRFRYQLYCLQLANPAVDMNSDMLLKADKEVMSNKGDLSLDCGRLDR